MTGISAVGSVNSNPFEQDSYRANKKEGINETTGQVANLFDNDPFKEGKKEKSQPLFGETTGQVANIDNGFSMAA